MSHLWADRFEKAPVEDVFKTAGQCHGEVSSVRSGLTRSGRTGLLMAPEANTSPGHS